MDAVGALELVCALYSATVSFRACLVWHPTSLHMCPHAVPLRRTATSSVSCEGDLAGSDHEGGGRVGAVNTLHTCPLKPQEKRRVGELQTSVAWCFVVSDIAMQLLTQMLCLRPLLPAPAVIDPTYVSARGMLWWRQWQRKG